MKYISAFILCLISQFLRAQDYTFSQFYEQPILRNPALAGIFTGDVRISGINRNQWSSVTIPYKTSALSVEYKLPVFQQNDFLTIGFQSIVDAAGDLNLKRTHLLPFLNFHKSLSDEKDEYLSVAFMGGYVTSQFDPSKIRGEEQYINGVYSPNNPVIQKFDRVAYNYWDLSTGISYSNSINENTRFYLGAGLFHVNKPKRIYFNQSKLDFFKSKLSLNAGLTLGVSGLSRIISFVDYYIQGEYRQLLLGAIYHYDITEFDESNKLSLGFGSFYRAGDAIIPVMKFDYKKLTLGISYDVNISELKTGSMYRGGLEITMNYKTYLQTQNSTLQKMRCVRF